MAPNFVYRPGALLDRMAEVPQSDTPVDVKGRQIISAVSGSVDSDGGLIPANYAISAVTRDASGNLLTQTITDGADSWMQTITRDVDGNLATMSQWVRL